MNDNNQKFDDEKIVEAVKMLITAVGQDLNDPNFQETPERVLRSYYELFDGHIQLDEKLKNIFSKAFPSTYKGIVSQKNIKAASFCPHHLLPIKYSIDVGYISQNGKMLGLSKLVRLTRILARRLVLQETFTQDIVDSIMKNLGADGAIAIVRGDHMCMSIRGVNAPDAITTTSAVSGIFADPAKGARQEFLQLVGNHHED